MITLPLIDLKKILDQIFNKNGYEHQGMTIKLPPSLDIKIQSKDGVISLDFLKLLPNISWKKFIILSAYIQGLELNETGGRIKIKFFPDIVFTYSSSSEVLSCDTRYIDVSDIEQEIKNEYPDEERQKLADRCLYYANEWATICCASGITKDEFASNKKLKRQCYNFVKQSVIEEKRHGSVIITFILIYVILPVILKWIIEKIFKKLTS